MTTNHDYTADPDGSKEFNASLDKMAADQNSAKFGKDKDALSVSDDDAPIVEAPLPVAPGIKRIGGEERKTTPMQDFLNDGTMSKTGQHSTLVNPQAKEIDMWTDEPTFINKTTGRETSDHFSLQGDDLLQLTPTVQLSVKQAMDQGLLMRAGSGNYQLTNKGHAITSKYAEEQAESQEIVVVDFHRHDLDSRTALTQLSSRLGPDQFNGMMASLATKIVTGEGDASQIIAAMARESGARGDLKGLLTEAANNVYEASTTFASQQLGISYADTEALFDRASKSTKARILMCAWGNSPNGILEAYRSLKLGNAI